jgi:imidazoleglycerol-phosphate dehydratase
MRSATFRRKTKETDIAIDANLDGAGLYVFECPLGFLSHMLDAFSRFSLIDLSGRMSGDLDVDPHHSVEDAGFCLGSALREALGGMEGIARSGFAYFPMDEALARAVIDFSGRPLCLVKGKKNAAASGDFSRELFVEFWQGFSRGARATLHIDLLRGSNGHHLYEAGFKAAGRAVMAAVAVLAAAKGAVPSTKGSIDGSPSTRPYPDAGPGKARLA